MLDKNEAVPQDVLLNATMAGKKKISQQAIAEALGVSQSLVSIVLNGRREGISPENYTRIWDYALRNGYSPKGMKLEAQPGQGERPKSMGYFLRAPLRLATKSNYFSHIHQGLHDLLAEDGIHTLFLGSEADFVGSRLERVAEKVEDVHGIVVMGEVAPAFLGALRRLGKPLVYVSARAPGICHSVNSNEYESGSQLVSHLVELGHRHFAFFAGMHARNRNEERIASIRAALGEHDLAFDESRLFELEDAERDEGYEMAEILLKRRLHPFPTAWICVNALLARGAITRLREADLEVGKHVSVVAFDQTRVCTEETPRLTSAAAVPEEIGRTAAKILLQTTKENSNAPLQDLILPSTLAVRDTSGPPVALPAKAARALIGA